MYPHLANVSAWSGPLCHRTGRPVWTQFTQRARSSGSPRQLDVFICHKSFVASINAGKPPVSVANNISCWTLENHREKKKKRRSLLSVNPSSCSCASLRKDYGGEGPVQSMPERRTSSRLLHLVLDCDTYYHSLTDYEQDEQAVWE